MSNEGILDSTYLQFLIGSDSVTLIPNINTIRLEGTSLAPVNIQNAASIQATSAIFSGPVNITNTLNVTSLATFGTVSATSGFFNEINVVTINISGPSIQQNLSVTSLTVTGPSILQGPTNISNTLNVTSLATFGPISATSATHTGASLLQGPVTIPNTLNVTGPCKRDAPV